MIISNASNGQKAPYSLSGDVLTVGDVSIDLQQRQNSTERVIDVCLDRQLISMREGLGAWYVANAIIPPKQYELVPTGEKDEEGNDVYQEVELPVDLRKVELRLWGLPEGYGEPQPETVEGVTE